MSYISNFVEDFLTGYRNMRDASLAVAGNKRVGYDITSIDKTLAALDSFFEGNFAEVSGSSIGMFRGVGTMIRDICTRHKSL